MVIDYLDRNLEELLNMMKEKKFSLKTVLMIADQIVNLIIKLNIRIIHSLIKLAFKNRIYPLKINYSQGYKTRKFSFRNQKKKFFNLHDRLWTREEI